MKKLFKFILALTLAAPAVACQVSDPRGAEREQYFIDPAAPGPYGATCGAGFNPCASGLTCFDNACTPDAIVAACTAAPSCGSGFCIARGDSFETTFCNCPSGEVWDGETCVEDTAPDFPGSVIDGTCPEALLVPDDPSAGPDPATEDCPAGSFCTADSGGDCLQFLVNVAGEFDGTTLAGSVTGGTAETDATCTRLVNADEEGAGLRLAFTGALATALGANTSITIELTEFDGTGTGFALVWPQGEGNSAPGSDAGYVDVTVDGTTADGIGGFFDIDVQTDDEAPENVVGGSFYIALDGGDLLTGAFTVPCGADETI